MQILTKKQGTRILHKIYRILENNNIRSKINRNLRWEGAIYTDDGFSPDESGNVDWTKKKRTAVVILNPKSPRFIKVLLHELLHFVDWRMDDSTGIDWMEEQLFKVLTDKQIDNLLRRFYSR